MYEIIDVQDVSRPKVKRFIAHIKVFTLDKSALLETIREVTSKIKTDNEEYCLPNTSKKFGESSPAHVVRLYLHYQKDDNLIGQSMWMDRETPDIILPKSLVYNDEIGDIGVAWMF